MKVLIVANDPGGANAIRPVAQRLSKESELLVLLTGPARDIFARAGVSFVDATEMSIEEVRELIDAFTPDVYFAGPSLFASLDKNVLAYLKGKTRSVYVLDVWNEKALWFTREPAGPFLLPDYICVPDEKAKADIVAAGYPEEILCVTGNPYFEHFTDGITRDAEDSSRVLFISQPVSEFEGKPFGFDEYDVLHDIANALQILGEEFRLVIRLHPREPEDKYDSYISERVSVSDIPLVEDDLSASSTVIGMFSPVLIQAAAAGKRVISYEPGLLGRDPLSTNITGHTKRVASIEELVSGLSSNRNSAPRDFSLLTKTRATEKILRLIDET